jgi:hypothetical protein
MTTKKVHKNTLTMHRIYVHEKRLCVEKEEKNDKEFIVTTTNKNVW